MLPSKFELKVVPSEPGQLFFRHVADLSQQFGLHFPLIFRQKPILEPVSRSCVPEGPHRMRAGGPVSPVTRQSLGRSAVVTPLWLRSGILPAFSLLDRL